MITGMSINKKPDRKTTILNIIQQVRAQFPFDDVNVQICGDSCIGCPKKLLELVESEINHWEYVVAKGNLPNMSEIDYFAKLCKNIRRSLVRNGVLPPI